MVESRATHGKTDEEMSMAIINLQTIINIEDMDVAIKLLEQNGWDESLAASAYMAQQVRLNC
jgi:hypothetical protein